MSSLPPIGGIIRRIAFTVGAGLIVSLGSGRFAAQIRSANCAAWLKSFAGGNPLPLFSAGDRHPVSPSFNVQLSNRAMAVAWMQGAA